MSRRMKQARWFLIIGFCVFLSVFSAYLRYNDLGQSDLFFTDTRLENPDPDGLSADSDCKMKIFPIGLMCAHLPLGIDQTNLFPSISIPASSFEPRIFGLRC